MHLCVSKFFLFTFFIYILFLFLSQYLNGKHSTCGNPSRFVVLLTLFKENVDLFSARGVIADLILSPDKDVSNITMSNEP